MYTTRLHTIVSIVIWFSVAYWFWGATGFWVMLGMYALAAFAWLLAKAAMWWKNPTLKIFHFTTSEDFAGIRAKGFLPPHQEKNHNQLPPALLGQQGGDVVSFATEYKPDVWLSMVCREIPGTHILFNPSYRTVDEVMVGEIAYRELHRLTASQPLIHMEDGSLVTYPNGMSVEITVLRSKVNEMLAGGKFKFIPIDSFKHEHKPWLYLVGRIFLLGGLTVSSKISFAENVRSTVLVSRAQWRARKQKEEEGV